MQKIRYTIASFFILLFCAGCTSVGFADIPASKNTATIYSYVDLPQNVDETVSDPCYKISINKDLLENCMKSEEFMVFEKLKPQTINISAIRDDIEKKTLELSLEAGKTYFLKVQSYSQLIGQFEFKEVNRETALKSIGSMKMANPPEKKDDAIFDFFASEEKSEKTEFSSSSKMDEIQKASDMKEKGVITQKEFDTLKAEILAK